MILVFAQNDSKVFFKIEDGMIFFRSYALNITSWIPVENTFIPQVYLREHPELNGMTNADIMDHCKAEWETRMKTFKNNNDIKNYILQDMTSKGAIFLEEINQ